MFLAQSRGSRSERRVLRRSDWRMTIPCSQLLDGRLDGADSEFGQASFERLRVFFGTDGRTTLLEDRAGVQTRGHVDHRDTSFGLAVIDGPLDGSRTAVFGKERAVEIDAAESGSLEYLGGKYLTVIADDQQVGAEVAKVGH